jgi:hypothetical protein
MMLLNKKQTSCCSGPSCCGSAEPKITSKRISDNQEVKKSARKIMIDFLYLDLEVCSRCQGTDDTLDAAISEIRQILEAAGTEVVVNKINVSTEVLARQYEFVSSPTIRIDGVDIDTEVKESLCDSCGDLCGDQVDCRVWTYQGIEYNQPPKAMIINAILSAVYGTASQSGENKAKPYALPENLKHFYEAMDRKRGI